MVHGDDFLATGDGKSVEELKVVLSNAYKVKVETLGNGGGDLSEIRVLNRVLRLTPAGYRLEADPRHAEAVIRDLGPTGPKSSKLPGSKDEKNKHDDIGVGEELHTYKTCAKCSMQRVCDTQHAARRQHAAGEHASST